MDKSMDDIFGAMNDVPEDFDRKPDSREYDGSNKHMEKDDDKFDVAPDWKEYCAKLVQVIDPSTDAESLSDEDLIAVIEKLTEGTIKKEGWDKLGDVEVDSKPEKPKGKSKGFKGASDSMMKKAKKDDAKFDEEEGKDDEQFQKGPR